MNNSEKDKKNILADLKKNPVKILALIYPYILIIGTGIGLFFLANLDNIQKRSISQLPQDSLAQMPADYKLEMPKSVPKADVMLLSQTSDSMISMGKKLFQTNCVTCHGANGKGDGIAAAGLNPKPRNFTSNANWINGPKISGIFTTLSDGIKGSAMVAFDTFTPEQKFALAQYIRNTFVSNPPEDTKEDLTDLSQTFHLSEAQKSPGQIPIKDALVLVNNEGRSKYQKITEALRQISTDANDDGATVFDMVTDNKIDKFFFTG